ncbi:DNA primase [Streptomyces sp. NBC_00237]|uniref:DNA primase n=1 Tax=Streptomyces sp. NBC_00237 TaxID=2975687 RepID=UPI0022548E57|nr:DNA primase [Streptomyces sp. NBC_00237]MCX5202479.1 DNA primase [Streptomyces sp. NBC_00237]
MPTLTCAVCASPLPVIHRSDRRHCSRSCEAKAYRARRRQRADVDPIPAELRVRDRWVRWSARKVPLRTDSRFASVTDPSSWSDYASAARSSAGVGLGYVLTVADNVLCIDLDHVLDQNGTLTPWAAEFVATLPDTFIEVSQSGTGLHIWGHGSLQQGRRIKMPGGTGLEVYGDRRYIAVTGNTWGNAPSGLADLSEVLLTLT